MVAIVSGSLFASSWSTLLSRPDSVMLNGNESK